MKKILVASNNEAVNETVKSACTKYSKYFDSVFCVDTDEAISIIDYEIPELKVLDFTSSAIDSNRILASINADPWLHNGGIIAVVSKPAEVEAIEEKKDPNILIVQTLHNFQENFERLLRILWSNQQFLFNRGMQGRMGGVENGSFVCGNDPLDIRMYTSILVSYLYYTNQVDEMGRYSLQTGLMELLTNALEHGNCKITYQDKTEWLEKGGNILDLINERQKDPEIAAKKIRLRYVIGKDFTKFEIEDEGDGFDWRKQLDSDTVDFTQQHGRGMDLSRSLVSHLTYNEKGNKVSFEVCNLKDASNSVPGIMVPFATVNYHKHDIICKQGEPSTDLYFIVSGRYGVYADGKLISVLTPADMFIGEMAFLLNDRRSATIMSAGEGKLIRIPKTSFLNLIRKNPHYGIFLSKLLAQRVVRQNQRTLDLTNELKDLKAELESK